MRTLRRAGRRPKPGFLRIAKQHGSRPQLVDGEMPCLENGSYRLQLIQNPLNNLYQIQLVEPREGDRSGIATVVRKLCTSEIDCALEVLMKLMNHADPVKLCQNLSVIFNGKHDAGMIQLDNQPRPIVTEAVA